jgi:hypothetical protein
MGLLADRVTCRSELDLFVNLTLLTYLLNIYCGWDLLLFDMEAHTPLISGRWYIF